jgi:hypothetical protein
MIEDCIFTCGPCHRNILPTPDLWVKIHAGNTLLIRISIMDENLIADELLNAALPSDLRAFNSSDRRNKNLD